MIGYTVLYETLCPARAFTQIGVCKDPAFRHFFPSGLCLIPVLDANKARGLTHRVISRNEKWSKSMKSVFEKCKKGTASDPLNKLYLKDSYLSFCLPPGHRLVSEMHWHNKVYRGDQNTFKNLFLLFSGGLLLWTAPRLQRFYLHGWHFNEICYYSFSLVRWICQSM